MASIRTYIWLGNLMLLGTAAFSAAHSASLLLEQRLRVAPQSPAPAGPKRQALTEKVRQPYSAYQAVLETNMFNAERTKVATTNPAVNAEPVAQPAPQTAQLRIMLSGTFIGQDDTYAFVVALDGMTERLYRVGDCLPQRDGPPKRTCEADQGRLTKVERDRITVSKDRRAQVFRLAERPAAPVPPVQALLRPPVPAAPPAPSPGGAGVAPPQVRAQADQFPANRLGVTIQVRVPNVEVEQAFENFADILKQAAVTPVSENGAPVGFQIRRIQPSSIFERMGLQNDDILRTVNGESLTTADQALRLFTLFRNEREVLLEITRQNQPLQLSYFIE